MLKTAQTNLSEGIIELGVGHPSLSMLPLTQMEQAAAHRFAQGDASFLQYGAELGDGFLRAELAGYLSQEYGLPVAGTDLMISGGVSQALDLICAMLAKPGDTIIVEDPTYFLSLDIFRNHGLHIVSAPLDKHGLDITALEQLVKTHRPKLIYTIPTHQNPTGLTLTEARRAQLVDLAQEHDFLILADEVYHLLTFGGTPPRSFSAHVSTGNVLSLGSFSKILAPGMRLGWIHGRPELLEKLAANGMIASSGGFSPLGGGLIRSLLELKLLGPYTQSLRDIFRRRAAALADALSELPVQFQRPNGGYFIWLTLPGGMDSGKLLELAVQRGVRFHTGNRFSLHQTQGDKARLCFAYYAEADLREGVRRLGAAIQELG